MDDGGQGREVQGKRQSGNGSNCARERLEKLLLADVQDVRGESVALVVDLGNTQTIGEGRNVQHVEERGLGGADLATRPDELQVGRDFNGTTSDLGGNTESLEEGGLSGFHTSVASGDPDVGGGDGTSTSRGSDLVGKDPVTDGLEVTVGEDETDVATDVGEESLVLGRIGNEGLEGSADL